MTYQKFLLRMELVPLVGKPENFLKAGSTQLRGFLLVTDLTENPESMDGA